MSCIAWRQCEQQQLQPLTEARVAAPLANRADISHQSVIARTGHGD
jgi:hypothetical protein